jgi:hypothetical protein
MISPMVMVVCISSAHNSSLFLNDLTAPIFRCTDCFMIHLFPKCPPVCSANTLCAYIPYSLLALPCRQCVALEDADNSLKESEKPPTSEVDTSTSKIFIFIIQIIVLS